MSVEVPAPDRHIDSSHDLKDPQKLQVRGASHLPPHPLSPHSPASLQRKSVEDLDLVMFKGLASDQPPKASSRAPLYI